MDDEPLILTKHDQAVHSALLDLRAVLMEAVGDVDEVFARISETYSPHRADGEGWGEIMLRQPKPLAVTRLHARINEVVAAAASLRRGVVTALLAEGLTKSQVSRILGLTHQRVAQITRE